MQLKEAQVASFVALAVLSGCSSDREPAVDMDTEPTAVSDVAEYDTYLVGPYAVETSDTKIVRPIPEVDLGRVDHCEPGTRYTFDESVIESLTGYDPEAGKEVSINPRDIKLITSIGQTSTITVFDCIGFRSEDGDKYVENRPVEGKLPEGWKLTGLVLPDNVSSGQALEVSPTSRYDDLIQP